MEPVYAKKIDQLYGQVEKERMESKVVAMRFADFREEVASDLGPRYQKLTQSQQRSIASVVPHKNHFKNRLQTAKSRRWFSEAETQYNGKKYDKAIEKLLGLVGQYPEASHYPQAVYYLVESLYKTNNKQEAILWSERLVSQFPDSLWTGRTLFVTAQIYMEQDRMDEALEIYDALVQGFKDKELSKNVKRQLAQIGGR